MLLGGILAALWVRSATAAKFIGSGSLVLACALGLIPVAHALLTGSVENLALPWALPFAVFSLGLDPLSAFFLLPLLVLSALAAIFGQTYLREFSAPKLAGHAFFLNFFVAAMILVLLARNGMLFLMSWEIMSLASFFLVTLEHEKPAIQTAGWIYLVAAHLGVACLLALFLLLGKSSGSLEFSQWLAHPAPAALAGVLFTLALLGFGTKAGFVPLHVWLPMAHPAAPSHVSALMSGVMIKLGLYGLLRVLGFFSLPPLTVGWTFIAVGLLSGIPGAVMALAQRDLKRLLAYSSVENIGIIALGLGLGFLGQASSSPTLVVLGFGGALFHLLNHAVFKSLLFLGAGSLAHATGTTDMEQMGGLLKKMPWTGSAFFIGALAACGLPPLSGFVGEFLIALGALHGGSAPGAVQAVPAWAVLAGLVFIGALAGVAFTKAFGIIFLGQARRKESEQAHEAERPLTLVLAVLALACLGMGFASSWIFSLTVPVIAQLTHAAAPLLQNEAAEIGTLLRTLALAFGTLLGLTAVLFGLRHALLRGREQASANTWDCGAAQVTPRMQYTASSYVQPLTSLFRFFLRTRKQQEAPQGLFPADAALRTETPPVFYELIFVPLFQRVAWALSKMRWLQHGRVQLYVLYIALALAGLLAWKLRP